MQTVPKLSPEYFNADGDTLYQVGQDEYVMNCPLCDGEGRIHPEDNDSGQLLFQKCHECGGEGMVGA